MSAPPATPTRFIGLDLHKHYLMALAVNPAGEPIGGPWRVMLEHLDTWTHRHLTPLDAVAVEITTNTYAVYDALVPLVQSVTVVHPPHLALIGNCCHQVRLAGENGEPLSGKGRWCRWSTACRRFLA